MAFFGLSTVSAALPAAATAAARAHAEPLKMLKANRIISSDILNNLLVFCTFGICSPFLAAIMLVSVSLKHHMWVMLLGRFVHTRVTAASGAGAGAGAGGDHALVALGAACVPLLQIVARCVWPVMGGSSVFFAVLCWDVLADEVGWRDAVWAPVAVLLVPVCLWACVRGASFYTATGSALECAEGSADNAQANANARAGASSTSSSSASFSEELQSVDSNPLHQALKMTEIHHK